MKILFLLNIGFDTQGASVHLLEAVIEKALTKGYQVHTIQKNTTGKQLDVPTALMGYDSYSYDAIKVNEVRKQSFVKRYLVDIKYALSCIKYYKRHKDADVVFLQSCNTAALQIILVKYFLKKPIVYNVQDIFPINAQEIGLLKEKNPIFKALKKLQAYAYKMADRLITISEDMKSVLIKEGAVEDNVDVIYNWSYSDEIINIEDNENKFIKDFKINDNRYKVVYAGNMGTMQNVDVIMYAAKELKNEKNIVFYIIGDGVSKDKYLSFAQKNGLDNVIFFPLQPSEYAAHIYSMADVNIIPLAKGVIKTALPSKTATCLACGKPIIACVDYESDFGRIIANCDNCAVVNSNDYKSLAKTIRCYYRNRIAARSNGERKLFKEHFSKEKNVERYIKILEQIY